MISKNLKETYSMSKYYKFWVKTLNTLILHTDGDDEHPVSMATHLSLVWFLWWVSWRAEWPNHKIEDQLCEKTKKMEYT